MRTPPMIRTIEALKQEIELLDLLTGIEIAVTKMNNSDDPIEKHYSRLKWDIIPVEKEDEKYKVFIMFFNFNIWFSYSRKLKEVS